MIRETLARISRIAEEERKTLNKIDDDDTFVEFQLVPESVEEEIAEEENKQLNTIDDIDTSLELQLVPESIEKESKQLNKNHDDNDVSVELLPESIEQQYQQLLLICKTGDWENAGKILEVC